jgi:transposase-like protein
MAEISYRRHGFPPAIIQHAVWVYLRFMLSYRDVEELLAERGLDISYETVRCWVLKFGPVPMPSTAEIGGTSTKWWCGSPALACRRSRGRGPRYAGSTPAR